MKRLLFVLTIALVALSLNSAPVAAQAVGATDVDISLEGVVVLHYFSNVDLSITSGALGSVLTGGNPAYDEGISAPAAGGMTFDLGINPASAVGDLTAVLLTLQNAWAVRSLGGASTLTQLEIVITNDTLTAGGGATMEIDNAAVNDGDGGATSNIISFPSTGLTTPEYGDVLLTLDMTSATVAGIYSDGVYTLTATLI